MAEPCRICGKRTVTFVRNKESGQSEPLCSECRDKLHKEEIEKKAENINRASDFKEWDHGHNSSMGNSAWNCCWSIRFQPYSWCLAYGLRSANNA